MRELVAYVAKGLVDFPEQVEVREIEGEKNTVIELKVAREDIGKVIGRQGRTARALRSVLNATATRRGTRAILEIMMTS